MTTLPFKLQVDPTPMQFLFTVKGPLAAKDLEGGRVAHNMAAGSDQGVAAALLRHVPVQQKEGP